ncbi:MAG: hypothetical protein KF760_23185 [Candidatus Eremiobacteraeota bacterium]|nr:hypothetical protein [Candidatus Eremiobacteraeota bacterium]
MCLLPLPRARADPGRGYFRRHRYEDDQHRYALALQSRHSSALYYFVYLYLDHS